jgi:hypothetical protein
MTPQAARAALTPPKAGEAKTGSALADTGTRAPGDSGVSFLGTGASFRTPQIARFEPDGRTNVIWTAPGPIRPAPYPITRTAEAWRAFLHDLYTAWGKRSAAPESDHAGG